MPNNRHLIIDEELVRPQQLLDRGWPIPGLGGKHRVDQGWCAVITVGGAYEETLEPGFYDISKYPRQDVQAIHVDKRLKQLTVATTREFTIARPFPVEVDLTLSVEYRVSDPRRVAVEIESPLTSLYDRVLQAVRGAVVHVDYEEFRTQGERLAQITLDRLKAMRLPDVLGIDIFNVLVTTIKGAGEVAKRIQHEWETLRDWQMNAHMVQNSQITPQWMAVNAPELYQQLMANNHEVRMALIDMGLLGPQGFLNQPANASGTFDVQSFMNTLPPGMTSPQGQVFSPYGQNQPSFQQQPPQLQQPAQTQHTHGVAQPQQSTDPLARIREEVEYLKKLSNVVVKAEACEGEDGLPDGTYILTVQLKRTADTPVVLVIYCPEGFPDTAPEASVFFSDDEAVLNDPSQGKPFQSGVMRRWAPSNYIVEIAREVREFYG
ncbi:MAG: hypothetical protein CL607_04395 [Anaerolineaceae bacterium]|nr:hypothetical protein [Anaerolineaceae bacterium]